MGIFNQSVKASTSSLPSNGIIIGQNFYGFDYITAHISTVQNALQSAGGTIEDMYLSIDGDIANLGQFSKSGYPNNDNGFITYAKSIGYLTAGAINVYSMTSGQYIYTSGTSSISSGYSISAANGTLTVTFNNPLSNVPPLSDFSILETINGGTGVAVVPNWISINSMMTEVTLTIPMVLPTIEMQNVVDSVQFQGSSAVSASFTVSALTPSSIQVSSPGTLVAGSNATTILSATVLDVNGQPISGVTVNWTSTY